MLELTAQNPQTLCRQLRIINVLPLALFIENRESHQQCPAYEIHFKNSSMNIRLTAIDLEILCELPKGISIEHLKSCPEGTIGYSKLYRLENHLIPHNLAKQDSETGRYVLTSFANGTYYARIENGQY